MIKLTVLYGHPKDADAFERYYAQTHMPIAEKMKTLRRFELSKAAAAPEGGPPPYYRMAEAYFDDAAHMQRVLASPEAQATIADMANFATGGVTSFVSEVLSVTQS